MRPLILALIFAMIFLICCYVASKGYRGIATSRSEGYGEYLPDHILTDPPRRAAVNRMVFRWSSVAAVLCLPPIAFLGYVLADPARQLHTPVLIGLAGYGLAVVTMAGYPVERMKSYGKG